jgi:hypothetical protein
VVNISGPLARLEELDRTLQTLFDGMRRLRGDLLELDPDRRVLTPVGLAALNPAYPPDLPNPVLQVEPPDPSWIPVLHRMERPDLSFPRPCGQVGVYLTEPPREHQTARLDVLRVLVPGESAWRAPTPHDLPRCSSCGVWIDAFSNADLDYLSLMQPAPRSDHPPRPSKRRTQRKPEVRASSSDSPGSGASDLPPAFPAHTPELRLNDEQVVTHLRNLADGLGLDPG